MSRPANDAPWSPDSAIGARTRDLTLAMVRHLSITGTAGEVSFPDALQALLQAHPALGGDPDALIRVPVPGPPAERQCLLAVARGQGRRAVVLCGHFDVVSVDDYGDLKDQAVAPEALRSALIDQLTRSGTAPGALQDLASGMFLPGRGILDMKSGLAAGMVALEQFLATPPEQRIGTLILAACPDEENQSAGMRALGPALAALAQARGLELSLMINLDALQDPGEGEHGRIVGLGSTGKHLLSALVVGLPTHVSYPFNGINASFLAGELTAEWEAAPELTDITGDEIAAAPTLLVSRDTKPFYDVTTPAHHWLALNVITQTRRAETVLETAERLARQAMDRAWARLQARAQALHAQIPGSQGGTVPEIAVWRFADVLARARVTAGAAALDQSLDARARQSAAAGLPMPEISRALTELAWSASALPGPAVVLGFGSLSYPAIAPLADQGHHALEAAIRDAVEAVARDQGTTIGYRQFLPIVSDMSFGGAVDLGDFQVAAANMPVWGHVLHWDAAHAARMPVINIGPWGRDYHLPLERVHQGYAFETLPRLVMAAANAALRRDTSPIGQEA